MVLLCHSQQLIVSTLKYTKLYEYLQNSTRLMKAEKSLGFAGCRLAAGSEVGITQMPAALFSSLKISCTKNTVPFSHSTNDSASDHRHGWGFEQGMQQWGGRDGPKAHSQIKMTEPSEHATQEATRDAVRRKKSATTERSGGGAGQNCSQEPQCPDRGRISKHRQLSVLTRFQNERQRTSHYC